MGPWNLGRWYRPLACINVFGCGLLAVGMQPPYDRAATIVAGSLVVLAAACPGSERRRFGDRRRLALVRPAKADVLLEHPPELRHVDRALAADQHQLAVGAEIPVPDADLLVGPRRVVLRQVSGREPGQIGPQVDVGLVERAVAGEELFRKSIGSVAFMGSPEDARNQ